MISEVLDMKLPKTIKQIFRKLLKMNQNNKYGLVVMWKIKRAHSDQTPSMFRMLPKLQGSVASATPQPTLPPTRQRQDEEAAPVRNRVGL